VGITPDAVVEKLIEAVPEPGPADHASHAQGD
jgi:hypothetical protein